MKKVFCYPLLLAALGGCSSIPMEPGAAKVIATPNAPPKSCKFLGQVVGNQGNFFTGDFTSNRNLEEGAMNDMKNKAVKLGANYVQLVNSRAGITGSMSGDRDFISGHSAQTNITNLGNAYHCHPKLIGLE